MDADAVYIPTLSNEELDALASAQGGGTHSAEGSANGRTQDAPIYSPPLAPPTSPAVYNEIEEKAMSRVFKFFDTDGSGELDKEEFELAMVRFGLQLSQKEIDGFFA